MLARGARPPVACAVPSGREDAMTRIRPGAEESDSGVPRRIVDMIAELFSEFSPDLVVLDCNRRVEEVAGRCRAELVGTRLDEVALDPKSVTEVNEAVRSLVAIGPAGRPARIADL